LRGTIPLERGSNPLNKDETSLIGRCCIVHTGYDTTPSCEMRAGHSAATQRRADASSA
jgi:hypothetical protein